MPTMPVGTEFFDELVSGQYYFVDKTMHIKEFYDNKSTVTLITRPRRFGKTLFLQMLKEFFSVENAGKKNIFTGLEISQEKEFCKANQNKYPIIFFTLKEIKKNNFEDAHKNFSQVISGLFDNFKYLMESDKIDIADKEWFSGIYGGVKENIDWGMLEISVKKLMEMLYVHHGVKPIVLLDEYDTPIQIAWQKGYYDDMIGFMKAFLGNILKTNPALNFAVLTGVLRISKESIFSDLNNLDVCTVTSKNLNTIIGFTEEETLDLASQINAADKMPEIKQWYNGYSFGGVQIYNPFSVVKYLKEKCTPDFYWINTSSNGIIKDMLKNADKSRIDTLKGLLQGQSVHTILTDKVVYGDIFNNDDALYTMLLTTGYLKGVSEEYTSSGIVYEMQIPNLEVYKAYEKEIIGYVTNSYSYAELKSLLDSIRCGVVGQLQEKLSNMLLRMTSVYDTGGTKSSRESFYHGLLLGLTAMLQTEYIIKSNRESGYGRFDLALFPKTKGNAGVIMEFKVEKRRKEWGGLDEDEMDEILVPMADAALQQIEAKKYITEFSAEGVDRVTKLGIAFCGKYVAVRAN